MLAIVVLTDADGGQQYLQRVTQGSIPSARDLEMVLGGTIVIVAGLGPIQRVGFNLF